MNEIPVGRPYAEPRLAPSRICAFALAICVALLALPARAQTLSKSHADPADESRAFWFGPHSEIRRSNVDGSDHRTIFYPEPEAQALAFDAVDGKLYFSERVWNGYNGSRGELIRRVVPGQHVYEDVVTGEDIRAIAIDEARRMLYWVEADSTPSIKRASLDGTNVTTVVDTGLVEPVSLELDATSDRLYWSDLALDQIRRSNLDGSGIQVVIRYPNLIDIEIDQGSSRLYWTGGFTEDPELVEQLFAPNKILSSTLDGADVDTVLTGPFDALPGGIDNACWGGMIRLALAPWRDEVYWSSPANPTGGVCRANLDGSDVTEIAGSGHVETFLQDHLGDPVKSDLLIIPSLDLLLTTADDDYKGEPQESFGLGSLCLSDPWDCDEDLRSWPRRATPRFGAGLLVDAESGGVYFTDITGGGISWTGHLYRTDVEGSTLEQVPMRWAWASSDLAYDPTRKTFHMAGVRDFHQDLDLNDGLSIETLTASTVALDTLNGKRFYVFSRLTGCSPNCLREQWLVASNLDGSGATDVVKLADEAPTCDPDCPDDLGVHIAAQRLYWRQGNRIRSTRTDGTDLKDVLTSSDSIDSFFLEGKTEKLYWTAGGHLRRANLDGGNVTRLSQLGPTADLFVVPGLKDLLQAAQPVLVSPGNGEGPQLTSLTLRWEVIAHAERYNVQVTRDASFSTFVLHENVPAAHAAFVSPTTDATYYWRVQGAAGGFTSNWSETWSFTVGMDGPLVPNLLLPSDNAGNQSRNLDFSWTAAPSAAVYHLQLSESENFGTLVADHPGLTTTSFQAAGLKGATRYFWRVAGVDAQGRKTFSQTRSFTTVVDAPSAVTLLSPDDGAVHVPRLTAFSWNPLPAAGTYQLQIATDEAFTHIAVSDSALTTATRTLTAPLNHGTGYYWRVRGRNAGGNGAWSAIRSFTTIVANPSAIALIEPSDGAANVPVSPVFGWAESASALMYQLQVARDISFGDIVVNDSALTTTTRTLTAPLNPGTGYYWRVRGRNAGGNGAWSEIRSFTTLVARPGEIALIEPSDGAKGVPINPVFIWTGSESALMYQLQVARDSTFGDVVVNDSALADPHDSLSTALEPAADYHWRVRARNAGGDGPWSEARSLRTAVSAPDAVALGAPEDGATGVTPFANLTWQTIDDVIGYHLQLSADPAFATPIVDDSTLTDPSWMAVDPLAYSTTFYWHVRAARDDGLGKSMGVIYGPWSETRSFTVAVGTASESNAALPTEFALHQNYPNPFNPSTVISYDLPAATIVRLVVFDAAGRLVKTLVSEIKPAGRHSTVWRADRFPSGAYFVRIRAGSFTENRTMQLVR